MDSAAIKQHVDMLAMRAQSIKTPCADGEMVFRQWNEGASEPVVLLHGGSGSWTHWIANIEPLAEKFELLAADLPGLGDSAALPKGYTAEDAAHWVRQGLKRILGGKAFHLVAFSWGCTVGAILAPAMAAQLKSMLLLGPAALGDMQPPQMQPLLRRNRNMTRAEIFATHRENLARLMIHDRSRIDDLAVWLQTENTDRSRFNSPQFARSTLVLDGISRVRTPLYVIYGEFDAPAYPNFAVREERLRSVRPDMRFELVAGGGHWLQYELPDEFNARCIDWLLRCQGDQ